MRAPWLESHKRYEGVGAHELNTRYMHVDDWRGVYDLPDYGIKLGPLSTPALAAATAKWGVPAGRLDGADTSHYQVDVGPIDFGSASRAGLYWWAHKVTQSIRYRDPTWAAASAAMLRTGFRQILGYHWLSSTTDPVAQARWYLTSVADAVYSIGVMGDCEEQGLTPEMCLAFYETIENVTHRPCAHYTGAYVGGGRIFADPRIRQSQYGPRPVILAAYTTRAKMLALPNVRALGIHAWQFSSNGPVPGVSGRCDMDEIQDDAAFDRVCRVPPPPTVVPDIALKGGKMFAIIANSDNPNSPQRWAWNGIVKVDLTYAKFLDFLHNGLLLPGHDSLTTPGWMDTATLDSYPTI